MGIYGTVPNIYDTTGTTYLDIDYSGSDLGLGE